MEIKGANIEFLGHSGFLISTKGERIAIDPYNVSSNVGKVDLILITHSHYDHCSIKDIRRLVKKGTTVVIPADAQSKVMKIEGVDMQVIEIGDECAFGKIRIEALPSYTLNKKFHHKKEGWLGYLIKINNTIIYHSGDCDKMPEMKKLTGYGKKDNNFVALLPVSGAYVMAAEEAAEVALLLNADLAIPMHYGAGVAGTIKDAERFVKLCKESGVNAALLEKI